MACLAQVPTLDDWRALAAEADGLPVAVPGAAELGEDIARAANCLSTTAASAVGTTAVPGRALASAARDADSMKHVMREVAMLRLRGAAARSWSAVATGMLTRRPPQTRKGPEPKPPGGPGATPGPVTGTGPAAGGSAASPGTGALVRRGDLDRLLAKGEELSAFVELPELEQLAACAARARVWLHSVRPLVGDDESAPAIGRGSGVGAEARATRPVLRLASLEHLVRQGQEVGLALHAAARLDDLVDTVRDWHAAATKACRGALQDGEPGPRKPLVAVVSDGERMAIAAEEVDVVRRHLAALDWLTKSAPNKPNATSPKTVSPKALVVEASEGDSVAATLGNIAVPPSGGDDAQGLERYCNAGLVEAVRRRAQSLRERSAAGEALAERIRALDITEVSNKPLLQRPRLKTAVELLREVDVSGLDVDNLTTLSEAVAVARAWVDEARKLPLHGTRNSAKVRAVPTISCPAALRASPPAALRSHLGPNRPAP